MPYSFAMIVHLIGLNLSSMRIAEMIFQYIAFGVKNVMTPTSRAVSIQTDTDNSKEIEFFDHSQLYLDRSDRLLGLVVQS